MEDSLRADGVMVTNADAGYVWVKIIVRRRGGRLVARGERSAVSAVAS